MSSRKVSFRIMSNSGRRRSSSYCSRNRLPLTKLKFSLQQSWNWNSWRTSTHLWKLFSLTFESFTRLKWRREWWFIIYSQIHFTSKKENIFSIFSLFFLQFFNSSFFLFLPSFTTFEEIPICLLSEMNERCAGALVTAPQRIFRIWAMFHSFASNERERDDEHGEKNTEKRYSKFTFI